MSNFFLRILEIIPPFQLVTSLTLSRSVTRARIRVPLRRQDNLSRDGVFQHLRQCEGQDSRRGGLRTSIKTITGKTSCFQPVGSISNQFSTRGSPSEQSLPRTTSLRLARQVYTPHNKSPPRTTSRSFARAATVSD
jgi:hypothetical protein